MDKKILPYYEGKWGITGKTWTRIEHTAFWIGIFFAIFSFCPVHAKVVVEPPTLGNPTVFEWTVPAGNNYHQLVSVDSNRTMLICVDPDSPMEFDIQPGSGPNPTEIGGPTESACQVVYGQTVRGKSKNGQPQKGRIAVSLAR